MQLASFFFAVSHASAAAMSFMVQVSVCALDEVAAGAPPEEGSPAKLRRVLVFDGMESVCRKDPMDEMSRARFWQCVYRCLSVPDCFLEHVSVWLRLGGWFPIQQALTSRCCGAGCRAWCRGLR